MKGKAVSGIIRIQQETRAMGFKSKALEDGEVAKLGPQYGTIERIFEPGSLALFVAIQPQRMRQRHLLYKTISRMKYIGAKR
jgi:hypothetical protein